MFIKRKYLPAHGNPYPVNQTGNAPRGYGGASRTIKKIGRKLYCRQMKGSLPFIRHLISSEEGRWGCRVKRDHEDVGARREDEDVEVRGIMRMWKLGGKRRM